MKTEARLTLDRVRFDQDTEAHLVLTLTAPPLSGQEKRARICVVPVIDVSSSMSGEKIDYTKKSVLKLVEHLTATDVAGIVVFSTSAQVLVAPGLVTDEKKNEIRRAVMAIQPSGNTNFADGMLLGCKVANDMDLPEDVLHRIIMFTDGQANTGPATRVSDVVQLFQANQGRVTASAFGYGKDASQDFLTTFARSGKGNYAFISDPDGALTAFGTELGGLVSTSATDISLTVTPQAGHEITSVVSDVDSEEDVTGVVTVRIPDILAEETRHIVLATKLCKQSGTGPRAVNAFTVKVVYSALDGEGKRDRITAEAKGKVQFVKEGDEQTTPDAALDKIVALAQVIRAQIEAEEKAKKGQYQAAADIMFQAASAASARGQAGAAKIAERVRETVSHRESYTVSGGYLRSLQNGGTRGMGVASYEVNALHDLAGAGVTTSNTSQARYANQFQQEAPPAGAQAVWTGTVNPAPGIGAQAVWTGLTAPPSPPPVDPGATFQLTGNGVLLDLVGGGLEALGGEASSKEASVQGDPDPKPDPAAKPKSSKKRLRSKTTW